MHDETARKELVPSRSMFSLHSKSAIQMAKSINFKCHSRQKTIVMSAREVQLMPINNKLVVLQNGSDFPVLVFYFLRLG